MKKISVIIANRHQTSISLEEEFWFELQKIALEDGKTINWCDSKKSKYS